MAGTDVIDLTGDGDDVRIVSNRVFTRDVQIVHPKCLGSVLWIDGKNVCHGLFSSRTSSIGRPVYHPLAGGL